MSVNENNSLYGGPQAGSTPANDADLHASGNPYNAGSPPSDLMASTADGFTFGSPVGYYTNPPTSSEGNPYNGGMTPGSYEAGSNYVGQGIFTDDNMAERYQSGDDNYSGGIGADGKPRG